jgi:hypothetical protein
LAYQHHEHPRDEADDPDADDLDAADLGTDDLGTDDLDTDDLDAGEGWVTVRQAAAQVGRSANWVRRQYRSGAVDSRTRTGRHGAERLVDLDALRAVAEARNVSPPPARPESAPLPVLAETIHELARQLGEVQERAARAEADAEELRRKLADAEQAATPEPPAVPDIPERDASLWLAANRQFLRTLPGAAAREAAGARLAGGHALQPRRRTRPWRRSR